MLKKLGIGARLGLGFLSVLLLTLGIGVVGALQTTRIFDVLDYYIVNTTPSLTAVRTWNRNADEIRILEAKHVMAGSEREMEALEGDIRPLADKLHKTLDDYETLLSNDEDKRLWLEAKAAAQSFMNDWDKLRAVSRSAVGDPSKAAEAQKLFRGASEHEFRSLMAAIAAEWEFNTKLAHTLAQDGKSAFHIALVVLAVACLVAILVGMAIAWGITRSIVQPLRQSVAIAQRVASGDLTGRIEVRGQDETAQLLHALKEMNEALARIVGEVHGGTAAINSAAQQIAQGNMDLSARTEEQASSLEETASSLEELTATVQQNANNAVQADQLAAAAADVAARGGSVVSQVVQTMGSINEASRKINDIIGVIDGIAFQTNILALNAAVEAARAGEQGRGFAVVATEVRNLAQRSAAAAKEIKSLIGDSVRRVEAGTQQVGQAGQTMEEIVASVRKVSGLIAEIAAASREQSMGIGQVNTAVAQMEQVVQQNASLAEESTAATEAMREQASALLQMVSRFRLADQHAEIASLQPLAPRTAAVGAAPIRVRASSAKLPAMNGAAGKPARIGGNGQWQEF